MKIPAAMIAAMSLAAPAAAETRGPAPRVAPQIVQETAPALAGYTDEVLFGDVWRRPDLAPRDRSLVTLAALIEGGNTAQMTGHLDRGLDNGLTPAEIVALITHLAFYSGWPKAMSAVAVTREVFDRRRLDIAGLAASSGNPILLEPEAEARRAAAVQAQVGTVAPALAGYTNDVLFGDLWRRADLNPRDRSLVTVAALVTGGQVDQLRFHMGRALDNGLTRDQLAEAVTHLAFYAGWPKAMSAIPMVRAVLDARDPAPAATAAVDVLRHGTQASAKGAAENFTGTVKVDSRFQRAAPARIGGGIVTFEPGARTAWHTHPLGQTLVVTAGCGLVQRDGGPVERIGTGDVVWIPPGVKHWHGATATQVMTHVAVAEALDGRAVDWMEHVTDTQYARAPQAAGC